jgi:hypothetical protein
VADDLLPPLISSSGFGSTGVRSSTSGGSPGSTWRFCLAQVTKSDSCFFGAVLEFELRALSLQGRRSTTPPT